MKSVETPLISYFFPVSVILLLGFLSVYCYESSFGLEQEFKNVGVVDVQSIDSTIRVELKYSNPDNFMGKDVYGGLEKCFLRPEAASMLSLANSLLKKLSPDLTLLVVDGLRPRRVQRMMWDIVKGTPMQKYVANPRWGSMHNYGCAVDITIADKDGNRLDMGTPVDHFGFLAQIRPEKQFLDSGKLSREQIANRHLLRKVMTEAGFRTIPIEWWHFEAFSTEHIRKNYSIIE